MSYLGHALTLRNERFLSFALLASMLALQFAVVAPSRHLLGVEKDLPSKLGEADRREIQVVVDKLPFRGSVDIGKNICSKIVSIRLMISNQTGSDLKLQKLEVSCGCIVPKPFENQLGNGECRPLDLDIKMSTKDGDFRNSLVFVKDGETQLRLDLSGHADSLLKLDSDKLQLSDIKEENSKPQHCLLRGTCSGDVGSVEGVKLGSDLIQELDFRVDREQRTFEVWGRFTIPRSMAAREIQERLMVKTDQGTFELPFTLQFRSSLDVRPSQVQMSDQPTRRVRFYLMGADLGEINEQSLSIYWGGDDTQSPAPFAPIPFSVTKQTARVAVVDVELTQSQIPTSGAELKFALRGSKIDEVSTTVTVAR